MLIVYSAGTIGEWVAYFTSPTGLASCVTVNVKLPVVKKMSKRLTASASSESSISTCGHEGK